MTTSPGEPSGYSMITGRVYASHVAAVEATFADGAIQRDATGAAVYAIVAPTNVPACELRALDAQAQVLARIDLCSQGGETVVECAIAP